MSQGNSLIGALCAYSTHIAPRKAFDSVLISPGKSGVRLDKKEILSFSRKREKNIHKIVKTVFHQEVQISYTLIITTRKSYTKMCLVLLNKYYI